LVAQSNISGTTVPMISKQHGVPTSRIYSWRGDVRFQPSDIETPGFTPVEVADVPMLRTSRQPDQMPVSRSRLKMGASYPSAMASTQVLFWNWRAVWRHDPYVGGCKDLAGGRHDGYETRL
jgi:hypothetical protein